MTNEVKGDEMSLLTVEEAAEVLKVSIHSIYKWTAAGTLPCVKLGRSTRFERAMLDAWVITKRNGGK